MLAWRRRGCLARVRILLEFGLYNGARMAELRDTEKAKDELTQEPERQQLDLLARSWKTTAWSEGQMCKRRTAENTGSQ